MSKKMAVRNKNDKISDMTFSVPNIFGTLKSSIRPIFKVTLLLGFVVVCVLVFQATKEVVFEQWKVTEISINNDLQQVDPSSIAKILKKDEYTYLLQIDVTKLQNEIKKLSWVKQAEIRKKWPNTIEVLIEEYLPIARINKKLLVDSGILIGANNQKDMNELPLLNFVNQDFKNSGFKSKYFKTEGSNREYLEIVKRYKTIEKNFESIGIIVESLDISESLAWTINTSNKIKIKIGRKQHVKRINRLISTLHFIEKFEMVKTIDLRYNNGFAVDRKEVLKELSG
ncbi:MAG: hypothetical protein COB38_02545 [Gammaproteobacteria bacterium]|nr:MAG: hypothetical protein COB38_02545 [Gammaproteobacteria bacterium]